MSSQSILDAQTVQDGITDLQLSLHRNVAATNTKYNAQKNDVLAARDAHVQRLIADGTLPSHFWADCIVAALQHAEKHGMAAVTSATQDDKDAGGDATLPHFLGPYDVQLLRDYLRAAQLRYTASGYKVLLQFATNPYFAETELWAECVDEDDNDDEDGGNKGGSGKAVTGASGGSTTQHGSDKKNSDDDDNDDDDDASAELDRHWTFSGVTWHDGYGPENDDDDADADAKEHATAAAPGSKRERAADATSQHAGDAKVAKRDEAAQRQQQQRGPSMLGVFDTMPPHPEADEELAEEDEDVLEELIDTWEAEMQDRETLLQLIARDVLHDPLRWWKTEASATSADKSATLS